MGKFHLEMHWWHSVHFALWDRPAYLSNTLGWYDEIFEVAKAYAATQGYKGVRWPKMIGPDGMEAPSGVGPLLVWQQPHPIFYAELLYRENPTQETLNRFGDLINATAEFMFDYAHWVPPGNAMFWDLRSSPPVKETVELSVKISILLSNWHIGAGG